MSETETLNLIRTRIAEFIASKSDTDHATSQELWEMILKIQIIVNHALPKMPPPVDVPKKLEDAMKAIDFLMAENLTIKGRISKLESSVMSIYSQLE